MYIVSGCLLGHNCKYNGGNNRNEDVIDFCRGHSYCVVCPETEGGLPMPRPPAEYADGRVIDKEGRDVTKAFERGAEISLEILKANSPSCGSGQIYDGTFTGTLTAGYGCFAGKLRDRGITVISEKEIINGKF